MAGKNVISDDEDEVGMEEEERDDEPVDGDGVDEREDEDEDEEEEEGQDEYEKDGFIVDDVEEEEDEDEDDRADSDDERQKKKKRKKRESERNYVLDEDDYELLQESNIAVPRPKLESKKFKRLKKAQRDMEDEGSVFYEEEEFGETGRRGRTAEQKLERSLFGDDEGQPLEDIAEEEERLEEEEDADIGEEDEMADFIVDEEEVDEHGAPIRRKKVNKKKSRQAAGVSSSALQEAHDIFGDVDELLMRRKQDRAKSSMHVESGEWSERRLEDEFDPTILAEKYMTEKDEHIRKIDVPERMQISEESTGPVTPETISMEESIWIYNQLVAGVVPLFKKKDGGTSDEEKELPIDKDDIMRFLDLMHAQKFDVPFIAMYRKEECMSLFKDPEEDGTSDDGPKNSDKKPSVRWHKVLWAIQDLDRKWRLLQKRKSALELYYKKRFQEESRRVYDETRLKLNQQLFESITNSLQASESEREVDDVDSKFNLHFPPGEVGVDEGQYKRPKRKSQYSICSKSGLWEVASKLGYSAEQFGRHMSLEKMGDELEDAREPPEEMASNFTCAMFETPQAVLKGARHMAAVEISCEPSVRKHVRTTYMNHAVVSTSPTPEGNTVIDSFHQFAGVKWLRDKPLSEFVDAQWLLIQKAEEEKLLQVTIKLPEVHLNQLTTDSKDHYLSDGVSKSAQLWNEQRKLILEDAIFNFLLPSMEKEARSLLTSKAKSCLLMEYGNVLWNKVSVGPYQRRENDISSDEEPAPRVMACCWGHGKPATTFVMLDSSGEVLDILYAGSLSLRGQNVNDEQRKKNDQQRLLKFMMDHQPHVVVLGAVNLSCTRLKEDIYEIIFKMVNSKLNRDSNRRAKMGSTAVSTQQAFFNLQKFTPLSYASSCRSIRSKRKCVIPIKCCSPSPASEVATAAKENRRELLKNGDDKLEICRVLNGMWQTSGGWGRIDRNDAVEAMLNYADAGLSTFDMADHYGPAEDLYGIFINRVRRERPPELLETVRGLTKWVPPPVKMTRSFVSESIDVSRRRMDVAALDMLQFHWWDYSNPGYLDALKHLTDLKGEGKIKTIALTNFDTERLRIILENGIPVVSNQVQHSIVDMRPQQKMAELCQLTGVKLITYGTVMGGLLSEKFLDTNLTIPFAGPALNTPSLQKYKRMVDAWGGWSLFQELLRTLKTVANKHGVSIPTVAVRFILDQPAVAGSMIGVRLGLSQHIKDANAVFSLVLDEEDISNILQVTNKGRDLQKVIGDCGDEYRRA